MLKPKMNYQEKYDKAVEFIEYCRTRPKNSRFTKKQIKKMLINMDYLVELE